MFPRQQTLQLAISVGAGRFRPPPWQIGLSHCLVILCTLSYNLGGLSTIINNHHPMSQNQKFQTMEPLIDLLSVCKFEFLSYSPVRKRKQKKSRALCVPINCSGPTKFKNTFFSSEIDNFDNVCQNVHFQKKSPGYSLKLGRFWLLMYIYSPLSKQNL